MLKIVYFGLFIFFTLNVSSQNGAITGTVTEKKASLEFVTVFIENSSFGVTTDKNGNYNLINIPFGTYTVSASFSGYESVYKKITLSKEKPKVKLDFILKGFVSMDEVVITGTMKPVSKLESPVPVEVYTSAFFKANPTPSVYEALQNVNGVRPQVNCAVCGTGDIHINGLEGAYSMILIDGMPIVSGLSTVYGLSGIPQSLIERVEIVKGPASTLYGSEAVGGLINVITKKTTNAPIVSSDVFGTSWGEVNTDLTTKFNVGEKVESLLGVNYFNANQRTDNNNDNFTDLVIQNRISIFNKWNIKRKNNRVFALAGRYVYEDRFGGDLNWSAEDHRGGDEIYGESIYTSRWEVFGTYQLPVKENMMLMFSANEHDHNSVYGDVKYIADQKIGFGQFTWNKEIGKKHDFLLGTSLRYTYYDDNTPATATADSLNPLNSPTHTYLPGIFIQDEVKLNDYNKVLLGIRYDYNSIHGSIYTPRINYKWSSKNKRNILRFGVGTGYRVANVFTEDHAALTGSREVVFLSDLNPETSINGNVNYVKKIFTKKDLFIGIDASVFYTYFSNKIFADYDADPSKIIYDNLSGYAVSNGVSVNFEVAYKSFKLLGGLTLMDVYSVQDGLRERQELTEQFTGTWTASYDFKKIGLNISYTGSVYGPMELPTQNSKDFIDPRPSLSPWWSIQNIQLTKKLGSKFELYGGVKNLLNWTPWRSMQASLLGNTADPFGKNTTGTELVFDPAYVYGPNQGIRGFFGLRYTID
jgi:outer membrane receptor for ferrienterochelin and colicins|tara:strand:+ start:608 stop:2875 length:2268 start_codon:yes stop_codon:yes gene_type:complete